MFEINELQYSVPKKILNTVGRIRSRVLRLKTLGHENLLRTFFSALTSANIAKHKVHTTGIEVNF